MKPAPCFSVPPELVEKAQEAEDRLTRALERFHEIIGPSEDSHFLGAMGDLIDADARALKARGK